MAISVTTVQAMTTKAIEASGGVRDAIFKNHAGLSRFKKNEGVYSGEKMTFPFWYVDDTGSTGQFYTGAGNLSQNIYDPATELSFNIVNLEETLVISHEDIAKNSGKAAMLKLVAQRAKHMELAMRQRFTKGIYSDGTASTGALTTDQFDGVQAFLKSSSVNYGGLTETDVATHIAYVASNGGTNRALTTALDQTVLGGASEGEEKPTLRVMRQGVMNAFVELLKPYQRTTRESSLNGLGHEGNTLVYSGVDSIVDNLSPANGIIYLNEKHVRLYSHPDYNMKRVNWDNLESKDAVMQRLFWKGVFVADVLRYNGWLKDISEA